jgi:glycosyltransferase involved in cell wall biosynthesis
VADVSIIVTAYNIEGYIQECLDSVAEQTLLDIEVLVVDDGSTDSTPAKIADYCRRDTRFVPVLLAENSPGGVATAANAGLDRATAPWVGFVDGDDLIEPRMFERLVNAARAADADLAMCDYQELVDGSDERRDPADAHRWAELTASSYRLDVQARKQLLRFISVPWRKLYRRSLLEDNAIRFPVSAGFYEDNPFHWFTVLSAHTVALVPEVLYYHRVGRSGQTMAAADQRLFQIFDHHDTIHRWLQQRRLLDAYETTLIGWVISQMEWIAQRIPASLRRRLFDTLVPIFAAYPLPVVAAALRDGNKGAATQRLSTAVAKSDYGSFAGTLATRPGSHSPFVSAAFHLRHSGTQHTTLLVGRYLRRALHGTPVTRAVARMSRTAREPGPQDVMFGLMVVQHRLLSMEQRLGAIEGRLGTTEGRLAATEGRLATTEGRLVDLERPTGLPGDRSAPASDVHEQRRNGSARLDRREDPVGRG